jgi:benzoate membrane transport protein
VSEPGSREAAAITFVVTAAGVGFLGIGAAFWGLLAGAAMTLLHRPRRPDVERVSSPTGGPPARR